MPKIEFEEYSHDGEVNTWELPARWEICDRCKGEGTHVNPAVDGNGLTQEDFDEQGPEFFEDYMSGVYDVACEECQGSGKILLPLREQCDPTALAAYDESIRAEGEYRAEVEAERRMGA